MLPRIPTIKSIKIEQLDIKVNLHLIPYFQVRISFLNEINLIVLTKK